MQYRIDRKHFPEVQRRNKNIRDKFPKTVTSAFLYLFPVSHQCSNQQSAVFDPERLDFLSPACSQAWMEIRLVSAVEPKTPFFMFVVACTANHKAFTSSNQATSRPQRSIPCVSTHLLHQSDVTVTEPLCPFKEWPGCGRRR